MYMETERYMPAPKIAVVNDDTQFLRMMHMILEEVGYDATIFYERNHVLDELKALQPDLIILDIRMESPDGGWVLLDLLTLDRATSQIPVIVCSAAHDDLLRKQEFLIDLGVRILLKPFRVDMLEAMVKEMLQLGTRDEVTASTDPGSSWQHPPNE
jgi:CheY-like chemotaxis protein